MASDRAGAAAVPRLWLFEAADPPGLSQLPSPDLVGRSGGVPTDRRSPRPSYLLAVTGPEYVTSVATVVIETESSRSPFSQNQPPHAIDEGDVRTYADGDVTYDF